MLSYHDNNLPTSYRFIFISKVWGKINLAISILNQFSLKLRVGRKMKCELLLTQLIVIIMQTFVYKAFTYK